MASLVSNYSLESLKWILDKRWKISPISNKAIFCLQEAIWSRRPFKKISCSYYQEIIIGRTGCLPVMCLGNLNCTKLFLDCMRTKREQFPVKWLTSGRLAFTIQCVEAMRRHQLKKDMISCNDTRRNTNINKTIYWLIHLFWYIIPLTT